VAEHDDAFRRIDAFIATLRLIFSPDMLRILGHRLIQVADAIEAPPGLRGSAYGWEPVHLAVRNVAEYRTARLIVEMDDSGFPERDIIEELQRRHMENRGGRLDWRADRLRSLLTRERGRRRLASGIDAAGSPLADLPPNVGNMADQISAA
jgi:hypothetical protein